MTAAEVAVVGDGGSACFSRSASTRTVESLEAILKVVDSFPDRC